MCHGSLSPFPLAAPSRPSLHLSTRVAALAEPARLLRIRSATSRPAQQAPAVDLVARTRRVTASPGPCQTSGVEEHAMRIIGLLARAACLCVFSGCGTSPVPTYPEVVVAKESGPPQSAPTAEEVVARMGKSYESTPVLHVSVVDRHHGVEFDAQG